MWGPRWIAKLVNITPITMIYGTYNNLITIVNGVNLNQLITGGPHIVAMGKQHERWRFSWEGLWIGLKCVQKNTNPVITITNHRHQMMLRMYADI